MPQISNRVQSFTDSVIRRMTRIANKYGAINLSQGFPDFPPPKPITDRLAELAAEGPHQYSITFGAQNFREALARKMSRSFGWEVDPDTQVLVTCGGTEAMMSAMMTVCNPGDRVIVFSPFYENYGADTILSGAEPIFVPLVPPTYDFDREVLKNAFEQNVKAIVVCNPSNPSGKVFTEEELRFIGGLCVEHDAYLITDEVYEHIVFPPAKHVYAASIPEISDHVVSCSSLSKTYSITGWRLGYLIGPAEFIEAAKKVHDFLTVGAAAPLQEAAVVGLEFPQSYYDELEAMYHRKRDLFVEGLDRAGLKHNVPEGSYFVLIDIAEFQQPGMPFYGKTDLEFCEWMIKEIGVAAVPGSSFFREPVNNLIRLHFARSEATLNEALARLSRLRECACRAEI